MFVKKVNAIYLDAHIQVMVENALLIINPPATTNVVVAAKHRTPLHHFVRKLILVDLARNTVERTLDYLLSLPWGQVIDMPLFQSADALCGDERSTTAVNSPAIVKVDVDQMLRKLFVRIWKIRFGNIALMADLLAGISEEHEAFAVSVVDDVLELIRSGLEEQHQDHQRRILMVKYLGYNGMFGCHCFLFFLTSYTSSELYNYKLVSTKTLFDTLYSFIFLGHNGRPSLEEQPSSAIDSTSDFFRVRLICTLLDTFGHYLRRGPANVRLDHFLVHFQHYILTKRDDLMPMEVEYLIADTLQSIQPGFRRETDPAAALLAVENLEASLRANMGIAAVEEEIEADSKRAVREKEDFTESDHSDSCSSSDEDNDSQDSQESTSDDDSVDSESFQEVSPIYVPSPEEQSEFDKELQHVMAESLESRATEKRTMLDLAVPSLLTSTASATCTGDATSMSYQLLLKRRTTKQRTIDIPLTSNIVTSTLSYQQSKIAERQQLKRMVLQSVDDD